MVVRFKREGGFAGMTLQREVEDVDLPHDAQHALSVLGGLHEHLQKRTGRRDGYTYTIEFQRNDEPLIIALPEEHVTSEVAPLIRYFESSIQSPL